MAGWRLRTIGAFRFPSRAIAPLFTPLLERLLDFRLGGRCRACYAIAMSALLFALLFASDPSAEASREVARGDCKTVGKHEIIVCADRNQRSPFRLPDTSKDPFDPFGETKSVMNERVGWAAEGDSGTQSCSTVGPGGWTGCMVKGWKESRDQTQWKKNIPTRRW